MQVTDEMVRVARKAYRACRPVERVACQDFGMQQDDILDQQLEAALTAALAAMWRGATAMEIRRPDGQIDEIIAHHCSLHIEQMTNDGWFIGIDSFDGSYHQFWLGAKNRKSHVEVRHTESVSAPSQLSKRGDAEKTAEG